MQSAKSQTVELLISFLKRNLTEVMRSIVNSHMITIKNLADVHKMCFE